MIHERQSRLEKANGLFRKTVGTVFLIGVLFVLPVESSIDNLQSYSTMVCQTLLENSGESNIPAESIFSFCPALRELPVIIGQSAPCTVGLIIN